MIRLFTRYLGLFKKQFILVIVFSFIQIGLQLLLPQMTDKIIKNGVANNDMQYILTTGAIMLGLSIAIAICMVGSSYFSSYVSGTFAVRSRREMFHKVVNFTDRQFEKFTVSTLTNRMTTDITFLSFIYMMGLRTALTVPLLGLGAVIVALIMNWQLTIILLIGVALSTTVAILVHKKAAPKFDTALIAMDDVNLLFKEKITGVRTIRAYNRQESEKIRLNDSIDNSYSKDVWAYKSVFPAIVGLQLIMNLVLVIIFFASSYWVKEEIMTASDLVKFAQYIINFITGVTSIVSIIQMMPRIGAAAKRVSSVLDVDVSKTEQKEDRYDEILNNSSKRGHIVLDHVTYGYPGADRPVLSDINLDIKRGERVAFLGTTGSGKSTLMSLILGRFDDYEGQITVDGIQVRDLSVSDMAKITSFAPQKSFVYNKTIFDNLSVANKDITKEEASKALKLSCADEFVERLDGGIDYLLSPGGTNISGGQRQRISLARCVAKDADIYIFDDSFSALDSKTEKVARERIFDELNDKTVIVVAQRIKTIMDADRIYLLDDGRIIDSGSHDELLKKSALYKSIYMTQFKAAKEVG